MTPQADKIVNEWLEAVRAGDIKFDDIADLKRRIAEGLDEVMGGWVDAQIEQPDTVRNVLVDGERIAHYDSYYRTWTSNSGQRVKRVRWWRELPKDTGADV